MLKFPAPFPSVVFVCTHKRPDGASKPCCADRGGDALRDMLKAMAHERGLDGRVRVFRSGCLGGCEQGPTALRYPDGEYMLGVRPEDLEAILDAAAGQD